MFEPLAKLLGERGDELKDMLADMRAHLGRIASNTETSLAETQYADYSSVANVGKKGTAEIEFPTSDGYLWQVFASAVYKSKGFSGAVEVYVNGVAPHNLVDIITPEKLQDESYGGKSSTKYWVPPRSRIIFRFVNVLEEEKNVAAHIQVERFILESAQPAPTRSFEQTDKDHHPSQLPHAPAQRVGEPIG